MDKLRPRPATADHLRKKQAPTAQWFVVVDPDTVAVAEKAQKALFDAEVRAAHIGDDGDREAFLGPYRDEAARLEAECVEGEAVVVLRLRGLSRARYDRLVKEHPPTAEQIADAEEAGEPRPPYDADGFAAALIAACCVEPKLSAAEWADMFGDDDGVWTSGEQMQLVTMAMSLCHGSRVVDLGKG